MLYSDVLSPGVLFNTVDASKTLHHRHQGEMLIDAPQYQYQHLLFQLVSGICSSPTSILSPTPSSINTSSIIMINYLLQPISTPGLQGACLYLHFLLSPPRSFPHPFSCQVDEGTISSCSRSSSPTTLGRRCDIIDIVINDIGITFIEMNIMRSIHFSQGPLPFCWHSSWLAGDNRRQGVSQYSWILLWSWHSRWFLLLLWKVFCITCVLFNVKPRW